MNFERDVEIEGRDLIFFEYVDQGLFFGLSYCNKMEYVFLYREEAHRGLSFSLKIGKKLFRNVRILSSYKEQNWNDLNCTMPYYGEPDYKFYCIYANMEEEEVKFIF